MDLENGPQDLALAAAESVASGQSLESLTRPLLELLFGITGLSSTYLTEVDNVSDEQHILFSRNAGRLEIPEGLTVTWSDTLCRRALDTGPRYTDDVPGTFPDSQAAKELGLQTYLSVPVLDHKEQVIGTLCGASDERVAIPSNVLTIMEMFARLIADQWERDRQQQVLHHRAARAERQLQERATYLAEAEHKLKSPLAVVHGWAHFLLDDWDATPDDDRRNGVEIISKASEQLSIQVTDMLEEARSQAMAGALQIRHLDVVPIIARAVEGLRALSPGHQVSGAVDQEPLFADLDETALWQVLMHLGENAIKYSPAGGRVEMTAAAAGNRNAVELRVRDQGIGMPDDVDVFEPFTRSQRPETASIGGTGIGLHIVRTLVESMGGTVRGESNHDGPGSTFIVVLPSH